MGLIDGPDGWIVDGNPPRWKQLTQAQAEALEAASRITTIRWYHRLKWKSAGTLGALMFVNYLLNCVSFRYVAKGSYVGVGFADAALAWWGFAMVQRIGKADTTFEKVGYTVGGILGSLLGLFLTK